MNCAFSLFEKPNRHVRVNVIYVYHDLFPRYEVRVRFFRDTKVKRHHEIQHSFFKLQAVEAYERDLADELRDKGYRLVCSSH